MGKASRLYYIKTLYDYPREEIWRLLIDGKYQQDSAELGFWGYESRQKGSVKGLLNAFYYIQENIEQPLSEKIVLDLHKFCCENVVFHKAGRSQEIPQGAYRAEHVAFSLIVGENTTAEGLEYLKKLDKADNPHFYLSKKPNRTHSKYKTKINDPQKIRDELLILIENYHAFLKTEKSDILQSKIIEFIQNCIHLHPFSDGNCRTFATLLLNMLFIQNELPLTILRDPNCFRGYSVGQIKLEVHTGIAAVKYVKKNHIYPDSETTINILQKIKAKELITEPLVHWLASVDQPRLLKSLITEFPEDILKIDFYQNTPLITASYFGKLDNVKWMICYEKEHDLMNQKGQLGGTAAFWAAFNGHIGVLEYLIRKGAFLSIPSEFGTTALDAAYESGNETCLKLLLEKRHLNQYTPQPISLETLLNTYLKYKKLYFGNSIPNTSDRKNLNQLFIHLKKLQETPEDSVIKNALSILENISIEFIHKNLLLKALTALSH